MRGKNRIKKQPSCHPDRSYWAKGLCKQCYGKLDAERRKERLRNDPVERARVRQLQAAIQRKRLSDPVKREEARAYGRDWRRNKRQNNPEFRARDMAAERKWRKAHPEYERERSRRLWRENPEPLKAAKKRYLVKNPDKPREWKKRWQQNNPEKHKLQMRMDVKRRKARKKGATICDFTAAQWEQMKIAHNHQCFYCKEQPNALTQDHCIPLSRNGNHTASNIVPACMPCNRKKGTMTKEEFLNVLVSTQFSSSV